MIYSNWQPDWTEMQRLDSFASIGEALDRYYRPERLNRDPDSRALKIKFREEALQENAWICLASRHDNTVGEALWARVEDGKIAVYRG